MLLERIECYLRATKMAESRFGREAVGDPKFVAGLRDGRSPRPGTVRRVTAYIEKGELGRRAESACE
jgi:hypothetical protein